MGFNDLRFEGWSRFFLENRRGELVAFGHKSSFCMVDLYDMGSGVPASGRGCQYMTRGWADIYNSGLACQFIDITGVAPGTYTLRIEADFTHQFPDSDLTNNFAELEVVVE